ncbi:helix-turn-helix transcriptional regulator [Nonomuraea sp. NPDC049709]|uniref:helix-turn-helix domain-containing protein n=1 Tax=Nonomuraea sp. NPDC049709 TaxID=3154736 RepID=UPI00342AA348
MVGNLRRTRLARGFSVGELAELTGVSKALISQIERGVANPTIEVLTRLATSLDLTFAELTRTHLVEARPPERTPTTIRCPGARRAPRSVRGSSSTRRPSMCTCPSDSSPAGSSPSSARTVSDLPTIATDSPGPASKDTSESDVRPEAGCHTVRRRRSS